MGPSAHTNHPPPPEPYVFPPPLPAGPTYQNPKSHDFQHTLEREEGGEDNVEHSKGVLIGHRGSVELDEESRESVAAGPIREPREDNSSAKPQAMRQGLTLVQAGLRIMVLILARPPKCCSDT